MCSGKSKIGRLLAQRLNWPHHDTDQLVASASGSPVAALIRERGEEAFRGLERETVRRLAALDRCVISTGGGVPLDPENMKDLSRDALVVWLRVRAETVVQRAGDLASRPLIDPSDPLGSVRRRMAEREPVYAAAGRAIDSDGGPPDRVVEQILALLPADVRRPRS